MMESPMESSMVLIKYHDPSLLSPLAPILLLFPHSLPLPPHRLQGDSIHQPSDLLLRLLRLLLMLLLLRLLLLLLKREVKGVGVIVHPNC